MDKKDPRHACLELRAYRPTVADLKVIFSQDYKELDIDLGPCPCPEDLMYVLEGFSSPPLEEPDLDELYALGREVLPALMGELLEAEGMAYRTQDPFWLAQASMARETYESAEETYWGHIDPDGLTIH